MTSNSLPTSIQCQLTIGAERRANELTMAALLRDVTQSAVATVVAAYSASLSWYMAYDKRQQRRRRHYRRAVNAVSAKQLSADAVRDTAYRVASDRKSSELRIVHIAGGEADLFANAVKPAFGDDTAVLPAYVCAEANRAATARRGTVTPPSKS